MILSSNYNDFSIYCLLRMFQLSFDSLFTLNSSVTDILYSSAFHIFEIVTNGIYGPAWTSLSIEIAFYGKRDYHISGNKLSKITKLQFTM